MTEAMFEVISKLGQLLILIIIIMLVILNIVRGIMFRNILKYTSRIDDMNNTLVSYAQKNGGIDAQTPEFGIATNINELKTQLIAQHRLSGNVLSESDVVITQKTDPALRGSIVTVTTNFKLPVFTINWLRGRTEWVEASPRKAEGIVHKYSK